MKGIAKIAIIASILALGIASCATKPPTPEPTPAPTVAPVTPEPQPAPVAPGSASPSSIQATATGLEPGGEPRFQKIGLALQFGSASAVKSWTVSIAGQGAPVFSVKGEGSNLPDSLSWDGKDSSGKLAAEGTYSATLDIDYGAAFTPAKAQSKTFILVTTPPSATFSPNPAVFSYAAGQAAAPIQIVVAAKQGLAKIAGWTIDIYDNAGKPFKTLSGAGGAGKVEWDGKGSSGTAIPAAASFAATLTVTDEFGGKGTSKGSFVMSDKPQAPAVSITTQRAGFSPTSTSIKNTIDLNFSIPNKGDVTLWKADVSSATKGLVRSYSGDGTSVPDFVRWDGRDEQGQLVEQGPYYSVLSLSYGAKYKDQSSRGPSFSLIMEAPSGSITIDPAAPVLADLGPKAPMRFTIQAKSAYAQIATWTMSVLDGNGRAIALFQANWPNNSASWDGKTVDGGTMQPGASYAVVAKVEDEYGNVGTLRATIAVDPLKPADEPSSIVASLPGFAPRGDGTYPTMDFAIETGDAAALAKWKVELRNRSGQAVRTYSGDASAIPTILSWDGTTPAGAYAEEGVYTARLSIDYGLRFSGISVDSKPFILDLTPPSASISLSTPLLSPDGDGEYDTLTIGLSASSKLAKIVSWSLSILDPESGPFVAFKGAWPPDPLVWDGKGEDGSLVESASDYGIVAKVRDEFGNVGEATSSIGTDIMVVNTDKGPRISVSSIVFKGFTADYKDLPADRAERNLKTLDLLAAKLAKFPDYRISLVGHAVMIFWWDDQQRGEEEQEAILIPLSKERADAIAVALIERGITSDRIETSGVGAMDPLVPNSDLLNRWKNRRVDFYLIR